jgi:hypothetical protein
VIKKDDSVKPLCFNEKVNEITSNTQYKPSFSDFSGIEWICNDWRLNFYGPIKMVGEWNAYKNTILEEEKNQIYRIDNNQLSILKSQQINGEMQNIAQKISNYIWDDSGELSIDDINYIVKMQDEKLYLYYNTKDIMKVGESFNVTVDNTYGRSLEEEGRVIGIGFIQFTKKETVQTEQHSIDNETLLIEKFKNREEILNQVFNTIEKTNENTSYVLSGGNDDTKYKMNLVNQKIDLTGIGSERAKLLFKSFLINTNFIFKGVDVKINKIIHEDGSGSSFLVSGVTSQTAEIVTFYYNTSMVKEHWLISPKGSYTVDTKLIVGKWSYDFIGYGRVTYGITTKYEYKADNTFIRTDLADNVKETGTWSVNTDNTKLKIVLSKKINIATQETTVYNQTFEYGIKLISNGEMILSVDNGIEFTLYFSRV